MAITQPIILKNGVQVSSCNIGDTITIQLSNDDVNYDHNLYYGIAGKTVKIGEFIKNSHTWTIPLSICELLPNTTEGRLTIRADTYIGYSLISSKTTTITVKVPESIIPGVLGFTLTEAVAGIATRFGSFIKDHSRLNVSINASGQYGATIIKYTTKILDKTYSGSTFTSDILNKSGTFTATTTITDSRGRTNTVSNQITVLNYTPPVISKLKAYRCTKDGTKRDEGTYARVEFTYSINSMNNKNTSSYSIKSATSGSTSYQTLKTGSGYTQDTYYVSTTEILGEYGYTIQLVVTDFFGSATLTAEIPTGFVPLDFNANGRAVAFGKSSEKAIGIEFNMPLYDQYDTRILNGLAFYESGGSTDPNISLEETILTTTNTPDGSFYFIRQIFYGNKVETASRTQYATPYVTGSNFSNSKKSHYRRDYVSGTGWSKWREIPVLVETGSSGIWTYRKWSNGRADITGKIPINSLAVSTALGGWYRSTTAYTGSSYSYPFSFSELPTVSVQYATNTGTGALVWLNDEGTKSTPPTCYLIRPTSSAGITGKINIRAEGRY